MTLCDEKESEDRATYWDGFTYYASPPQIPSRHTSKNTKNTFLVSLASGLPPGKKPTADSYAKVANIMPWMIAGSGKSRSGRGGKPIEIEEREKKTNVWYTS